ncbi:hypothetical protein DYB36_013843 [Aphanomyces astaci]|uniref:Uncharacterized protein n=2 Tax=Aphanomyces astaci TaxID=112090 RepID=A0A396ZUR3_APHAT|nr:hypothetical protein DYB36_013843 [Aphanomyces astaci]
MNTNTGVTPAAPSQAITTFEELRLTDVAMIDEKEDLSMLRRTLLKKRKLVLGAGVLLVVVVTGIVAIVSSASTESASTGEALLPTTVSPTTASPTTASPTTVSPATDAPILEEVGVGSIANSVESTYSSDAATNTTSPESVTTPAVPTTTTSTTTNATTTLEATTTTSARTTTTSAPTTPAPTPAPTEKLLPFTDTKFDWTNFASWEADTSADCSWAKGGFKGSSIEVSSFGRPFKESPVIRTKKGWSGEKVLHIEWTSNPGSDTNIWLLPTSLVNQFGDLRWPNCGEYDIFEMFNGDAAIGHSGTISYFGGGLTDFGQSTTHIASKDCFAAETVHKPMVAPNGAQYSVAYGRKTSMTIIFGSDSKGKFIQQAQDATLKAGPNSTYDVVLDGATVTDKIYNNAQSYWGTTPTGGCAAGFNPDSGYPFWGEFRLILQEQYQGSFVVSNFQVLTKTP